MFCPNCATQNLDGASFCRSCGANISLVKQALTGQLPDAVPADLDESRRDARRRRRHSGPPTMDNGISQVVMGIGFLLVAIAIGIFGHGWWWVFMMIPAFAMLGKGIAQIAHVKEERKFFTPPSATFSPAIPPQHPVSALPPRDTSQLLPTPPSVTEGTTRQLGAEAPTRHLGAESEDH